MVRRQSKYFIRHKNNFKTFFKVLKKLSGIDDDIGVGQENLKEIKILKLI